MEIEDRIAFLKMSHSFSLKAVFGLVFLQSLCRDNTDKYLSLMRNCFVTRTLSVWSKIFKIEEKNVNFLHFCHFFLHSERLDLRGFEKKGWVSSAAFTFCNSGIIRLQKIFA